MIQLDVAMWKQRMFCQRGAALNNAKNYVFTPLLVAAQSGKMLVIHYLTDIAAKFILMPIISYQICKQHTET